MLIDKSIKSSVEWKAGEKETWHGIFSEIKHNPRASVVMSQVFLLSLFYRADIAEPSTFLGGAGPAPATVVVSK